MEILRERDAIGIVAARGASFQQELAALRADAQLRRAARAPPELADALDDPQVIMAEDDRRLRAVEAIAPPAIQAGESPWRGSGGYDVSDVPIALLLTESSRIVPHF